MDYFFMEFDESTVRATEMLGNVGYDGVEISVHFATDSLLSEVEKAAFSPNWSNAFALGGLVAHARKLLKLCRPNSTYLCNYWRILRVAIRRGAKLLRSVSHGLIKLGSSDHYVPSTFLVPFLFPEPRKEPFHA